MSSYMSLDEGYVIMLTSIGSVLSVIGTLSVIISYILVPQLRKYHAFRLIFHISLADLVFVLVIALNVYLYDSNGENQFGEQCNIIGPLEQALTLTIYLWSYTFALTMYKFFRGQLKKPSHIRNHITKWILISWLLPIIPAVIPLYVWGYEQGTTYCWFSWTDDNTTLVIQDVISYMPTGILTILIFYYYIQMVIFLRRSNAGDEKAKEFILELALYPLGPVIVLIISLIKHGFYDTLDESDQWIYYLNIFFKSSFGFVNAIAYGRSKKIRRIIMANLKGEVLSSSCNIIILF